MIFFKKQGLYNFKFKWTKDSLKFKFPKCFLQYMKQFKDRFLQDEYNSRIFQMPSKVEFWLQIELIQITEKQSNKAHLISTTQLAVTNANR